MGNNDCKVILGVDIGGSHLSAALVNAENGQVLGDTFLHQRIDNRAEGSVILDQWSEILRSAIELLPGGGLQGIGIAMPGPFDYARGVSLIEGVNKYDGIFGMNIRTALRNRLGLGLEIPIVFANDAVCFALGESWKGEAAGFDKIVAVTLGTGFGSAFIHCKRHLSDGEGVPPGGFLYNTPFWNGIAEDYLSTRWLCRSYLERAGKTGITQVSELANLALVEKDEDAIQVFREFGENLGLCLTPWIREFGADCLVLGGGISKAGPLFLPFIGNVGCRIIVSNDMELSAIAGAANTIQMENTRGSLKDTDWRKTSQPLLPTFVDPAAETAEGYDRYPFIHLEDGQIYRGYDTLARWISGRKAVIIDGYVGNDWDHIRDELSSALDKLSLRVLWYETTAFEKPEAEIEDLVAPWMGEPGSVWGKRTELDLKDFYREDRLSALRPEETQDITIIIGVGAAICRWDAPVVYFDLPKNELQYRMRAGNATNLGKTRPAASSEIYKRYYFVDWVVLNAHRLAIRDRIMLVADGQWRDDVNWALRSSIEEGLWTACHQAFRVRPWFEAGPWGGEWMKAHIPGLPKEEVNYAWSFELIVPENGLVFASDGYLLELSFDWLMEYDAAAVLGVDAKRFGTEFPIRFDFLDTIGGGNLSIQCHPTLNYIREQFGERITQDETYYILDCKEGASVYLGFQESIDPSVFRGELETSAREGTPVDIERHVQKLPAHKHDLFLIPNRTIHGSGAGNLVLEISATPYIFTFKMYDWLRLDLDGKPRPINIGHAFKNLDFSRKGERVQAELVSHPEVLEEGQDWRLVHLPTHPEHFYAVHRIEFQNEVTVFTEDKCHVLMLVEGSSIRVVTAEGQRFRFRYAETFVIPAAAGGYRMINEGKEIAKVVKAFVK